MTDKDMNVNNTHENENDIDETMADDVHFDVIFEDGETAEPFADGEPEITAVTADEIEVSLAPGDTSIPTDETMTDMDDETEDAAESADESPAEDDGAGDTDASNTGDIDVVAANANRVNETLGLVKSDDTETMPFTADGMAQPASPATTVSSRIDHELNTGDEDLDLLKSYPTLSLHAVTYRIRKSGRMPVENLTCAFEAGTLAVILVPTDDDETRTVITGLLAGVLRPESGQLMNRSSAYDQLEPLELRGHRIGLVAQRFTLRDDLSAVDNLVYAMNASNRNFLKPKPTLAQELLAAAGLHEEQMTVKAGDLNEVDRRRVAIVRATCCEAQIVIADEPFTGLDGADRPVIADLLRATAHGNPKRCVIIVTQDETVAEMAEQVVRL